MSKPIDQQILEQSRELLRNGFSSGALARDKNGVGVLLGHPDATNFCVLGALMTTAIRVLGGIDNTYYPKAWDRLVLASEIRYGTSSLIVINDKLGQVAILSVFDQALSDDLK
jgi:hypothetical protein